MKTYTVILLRPDYIAGTFGQDTYMTHVNAESVNAAQVLAQEEACDEDRGPDGEDDYSNIHPVDYFVIAVIEGKHMDTKE